ncbi:MAG: GNAT family N-acetyltransferase [Flavobacteriaceae bacterium]|nr:GNAT family N-acetyltransferase [Flavobacteriaceae bacterium]
MYHVREIKSNEYKKLGELLVEVYSKLKGFPGPDKIPDYYDNLLNIHQFLESPKTKIFVVVDKDEKLQGGVVYFGDMQYYGAGTEKTHQQKAAAFRFLAVNPSARGKGLAKLLVSQCFHQARAEGFKKLMIHSTAYMKDAINMYKKMGFERFKYIDFVKNGVKVFGYNYEL